MATHTFADGSKLELEGEELILFLKATGQYVEPKSQAQVVAETMLQMRRAEEQGHGSLDIETHEPTPTMDTMDTLIRDAGVKAKETGAIVEIGNFRVMPDQRVIPKHVMHPGGMPPRRKPRVPFTETELTIMNALKTAHRPLTTRQIAIMVGREPKSVTGIVSRIFNTGRGVSRGAHCTWYLESWVLGADWWQHGYPANHWPEKEAGTTT